jgi:hypothetical protein
VARNSLSAFRLCVGISEAEHARWLDRIDERCRAIDPFKSFDDLASDPEGIALLFHACLRHDNPAVTIDLVQGLVNRAARGDQAALLGVRQLREKMHDLMVAKKNEQQAESTARRAPRAKSRKSTSTRSTSH